MRIPSGMLTSPPIGSSNHTTRPTLKDPSNGTVLPVERRRGRLLARCDCESGSGEPRLPRRALCLVAGRPRPLPSSAICAWVKQSPTRTVSERYCARHRASTARSSCSGRIAPAERAQGPKALAAAAESARPHPARPNPAAQPSWPSPARTPAQAEIQLSHGRHEVRERSCSACR